MSNYNAQKAAKLTIEDVACQQLDKELLKEFENFLMFLKQEKISLPWACSNGFNMNYRSKRVGRLKLADGIKEQKKRVRITVCTGEWSLTRPVDFDGYLEGQSDKIVGLLMERLNNKCRRCQPNSGCARALGTNFTLMGVQYKNVCCASSVFDFTILGSDMNTVNLVLPYNHQISVRSVSIEVVKNLIVTRKEYISKMLAMK